MRSPSALALRWALVSAVLADVLLTIALLTVVDTGWTFYTPYSKGGTFGLVHSLVFEFATCGAWTAAAALGAFSLRLGGREALRGGSGVGLCVLAVLLVPFALFLVHLLRSFSI